MVLFLLALGMLIAFFDRISFSVALADSAFQQAFRLTDPDRGILASAFFWSYAVLQVPAGWRADRFGVKRVYAAAFLIWSVAMLSTAFAASITTLLALRILLGCGEALLTPASLQWIRAWFPETRRGAAVGLLMIGARLGPAFGAPLAAYLITARGWRFMFLALGIAPLVWLIGWMKIVPPDSASASAPDASGGPLWDPPVPRYRLFPLLLNPVIWGTAAGAFCYQYFVYFCLTWMPAYLVERHHLSLESMGIYTMFSFAGMAALAAIGGFAADRLIARGFDSVTVRKAFILAGFLIATTELICAISHSAGVALFFAVISLSGLGLATANSWALTQSSCRIPSWAGLLAFRHLLQAFPAPPRR